MSEQENLLRICRAVMPGVAGVVLSTLNGAVVAHEHHLVREPAHLALHAASTRTAETSALVPHDGSLYLVVFVPEPLVEQLASCPTPAVAAV